MVCDRGKHAWGVPSGKRPGGAVGSGLCAQRGRKGSRGRSTGPSGFLRRMLATVPSMRYERSPGERGWWWLAPISAWGRTVPQRGVLGCPPFSGGLLSVGRGVLEKASFCACRISSVFSSTGGVRVDPHSGAAPHGAVRDFQPTGREPSSARALPASRPSLCRGPRPAPVGWAVPAPARILGTAPTRGAHAPPAARAPSHAPQRSRGPPGALALNDNAA